MMNLEGRLIGNRYEIIEKIGNGGMATVYKAKCRVLNRYVAVKVLKEEFTTDEEFIRRFNIEAQSAASLTHPNIVSVFDVGNEGNLYYIVMELVKGRTLKEVIVSDGALSWKWSINVAIQIASALETAHKNNIVHRDIKPHNIIITEDGIAKVTDFGIAKAVSNSTITTFGTTIGSVHYFSPEHARGGYTDAKSDLYSLGVVMYEMLTGRVPFDADTPVSVALKQMQEIPVEPKVINTSIPEAVNRIIIKAMQKDVGLRYASATEMLKDLSLALKNPDSNFVKINNGNDFPTQTVSTIYTENRVQQNQASKKKKQNKFVAFIKKHKVLSAFIGLILLFAISLGGTYFALIAGQLKDVQIPELVGMSKEEAAKTVEEAGLIYEVVEEKFDSEIPSGFVISQDPAYIANYTIKEKTTIKVVISKGQEIVTVPKVVGKEKEEAKQELEGLGLIVEILEETSKTVEQGFVIKQSVNEKEKINVGETITITISSGTGIEQVQVPNLVGKTEEEAKNLITSSGLTLKQVIETEDSTKNNGTVLKQDLEVGSTVDKNTGITITVNKLPEVKKGTIKVNVKSLLGGKVEYEDEEETTVKKVELKITVGNDIVYREKVAQDLTEISQAISGIGNVTIKVYIDDVLKNSGTLNLNTSNVYTAE